LNDCRLYGISDVAIQICMMNEDASFLAAWNACPYNVSGQNACLTSTDWRVVDTLNTKMTISERRATTTYDRSNLTIMDVVDLSPPIPTNYTAEDFFFFYDIIFATNQNQSNFSTTAIPTSYNGGFIHQSDAYGHYIWLPSHLVKITAATGYTVASLQLCRMGPCPHHKYGEEYGFSYSQLQIDHSSVYPLLVFGRSVFLICLVSRGFNL